MGIPPGRGAGRAPLPGVGLLAGSAAGLGPPRSYAFCRDATAWRLYKRRIRAASRSSPPNAAADFYLVNHL
jgi:hypothetical protein